MDDEQQTRLHFPPTDTNAVLRARLEAALIELTEEDDPFRQCELDAEICRLRRILGGAR